MPARQPPCLRCAKHIGTKPRESCVFPLGSNKCTYCATLRKDCEKIPDDDEVAEYLSRLRNAASDYLERFGDNENGVVAAFARDDLEKMQSDFTKCAEAAQRRVPKTAEDLLAAILQSNRRIEALLREVIGRLPSAVSSLLHSHP